jgi:membrane associated rhomboid family serine protease
MPPPQNLVGFSLPKPGPVLKVVLIGLFASWLVFALGMNWAGVSEAPFYALTADQAGLLAGQVWRLVTASLIHSPFAVAHILSALLGLYFLGTSLEARFGSRRFAAFLFWSATLPYLIQAVLLLVLPAGIGQKLVPAAPYGAIPAVEATAIAWAFSFRGQTVNLFFVLPVTSKGLVWFVVGFSILGLIAAQTPPSGHLAAFAGMAIGYLLGGGSPSPLRRWYLARRLRGLEREVESEGRKRQKRVADSGLRVIPGGRDPKDPGDKNMLN